MEKQIHYVYEWIRSDLNLPYYIGKGVGKRAYELKRNDDTNDVTQFLLENNIGREIKIIARFCTHKAALDFEIERIAFYWHLKEAGILMNESKGGEGPWGYKHGPEQLVKMSLASKGKPKSIETRRKMSDNNPMKKPEVAKKNSDAKRGKELPSNKGELNGMFGRKGELSPRYGKPTSQKQKETARQTCLKRTGENNPNYGKTPSSETKAKISASNRGQKRSEEAKANMRKPKSESGRAAIAASNKRRAELKRLASQNNDGAV
jgi:hypothetical protein